MSTLFTHTITLTVTTDVPDGALVASGAADVMSDLGAATAVLAGTVEDQA